MNTAAIQSLASVLAALDAALPSGDYRRQYAGGLALIGQARAALARGEVPAGLLDWAEVQAVDCECPALREAVQAARLG
jgi:hypothetical protein